MKLRDYPDTGSLYIKLKLKPRVETRQASKAHVDFDASDEGVGLDRDDAAERFVLSRLETIALPIRKTTAACVLGSGPFRVLATRIVRDLGTASHCVWGAMEQLAP